MATIPTTPYNGNSTSNSVIINSVVLRRYLPLTVDEAERVLVDVSVPVRESAELSGLLARLYTIHSREVHLGPRFLLPRGVPVNVSVIVIVCTRAGGKTRKKKTKPK